jgi:hypothetical protein
MIRWISLLQCLLDRQSMSSSAYGSTCNAGVANPQDVFEVYTQDKPKELLNGGVELPASDSDQPLTSFLLHHNF